MSSQRSGKNCKRIVIKIGSSLFYSGKRKLDFRLLEDLVKQVSALSSQGAEVVIVSSGAIALGMSVLHLTDRPKELSILQAAAAVGQKELMHVFAQFFKKRSLECAQVLLTWEDFSDRKRYLNAKNTLATLMKLKVIPVINENDTVSTDEIKFGDNDQLSALVASLISADLLIILSDVDGLLELDKKTVVRCVHSITREVIALASPTDKATSVGGMVTKIKAAKIAADSGIPCVIAGGRVADGIISLAADHCSHGTLFLAKQESLSQRQRWMAFSSRPCGTVTVDDGAVSALRNNKSLLAVGITDCSGGFSSGDIVEVLDRSGLRVARGKVSVGQKTLEKVKGSRFDKEVIHRDNMVQL